TMKKRVRRISAIVLCLVTAMSACLAVGTDGGTAYAASEVKPYIAFGASLKDSEKKTVMKLLDVTEDTLADYEVIEVTNEEEHQYLDDYIASSVIGTRALSSVKIEENGNEDGIRVTTKNINFCTEAMYVNALATAGFTNADVTVAGPFELSGTAALVGAIKAYSTMQGEDVDDDTMDAAVDELVTTGDLVESVGSEKAAQLMAVIKDAVVKDNLSSDEDIMKAIEDGADKVGVTLSDEEKQKIMELMKKIGSLDLDIGALERSAQSIYDMLSNSGIDLGEAGGWFSKIFSSIGDFFAGIGNAIEDFFKGIFG
ncbi:MAG: DUF1002 domain-containing protein, partial [Eubacterium sp.]|nr:DUF1002 domain-containing protein [Eubacterium sp.]